MWVRGQTEPEASHKVLAEDFGSALERLEQSQCQLWDILAVGKSGSVGDFISTDFINSIPYTAYYYL